MCASKLAFPQTFSKGFSRNLTSSLGLMHMQRILTIACLLQRPAILARLILVMLSWLLCLLRGHIEDLLT
jgi:hypothetical protein